MGVASLVTSAATLWGRRRREEAQVWELVSVNWLLSIDPPRHLGGYRELETEIFKLPPLIG
jgi:hypothetical protein